MAGWLYELKFAVVPGTIAELFTIVVHWTACPYATGIAHKTPSAVAIPVLI